MKSEQEIIIDGVDVRKCKHFKAWYESRPNGFGGITIENYCYLYEDNCEKYPQCLYRSNQLQQLETQLKRKEQECEAQRYKLNYYIEKTTQLLDDIDNYKQALDEIEQTISNSPSKGIQEILQTQMEYTQSLLSVSETKLQKILDIIHKAKEQ